MSMTDCSGDSEGILIQRFIEVCVMHNDLFRVGYNAAALLIVPPVRLGVVL